MITRAHPLPPSHCWGPHCVAPVREADENLLPRFCSDPCQERFVAERRIIINAPAVPVHIHPELREHVVLSDVVPKGVAIVAVEPELLTKQLLEQQPIILTANDRVQQRDRLAEARQRDRGGFRGYHADLVWVDEVFEPHQADAPQPLVEPDRYGGTVGSLIGVPIPECPPRPWWRRAVDVARSVFR